MSSDHERLRRVRQVMEREQLDALVCRLPEHVLFLSGHWPLVGWSWLWFPREGKPVCIVPHCDAREAEQELWEAKCEAFRFGVLSAGNPYEEIARRLQSAMRGRRPRRIGYEGDFEAVAPPWNAAEPAIPAAATRRLLREVFGAKALVDATPLLNELRARKTPHEQRRMRIASEIAAFGLEAFRRKVDVGVSGVELVAHVERAVLLKGTGYRGARRVRAFAQVATGRQETAVGYRPMEISSLRKLRNRDLALLELGVVVDGFWSDRTRVRVAGQPTARQRDVFDAVVTAQEAAIAAVRPGMAAGAVDRAARAIMRARGYGKEFLHVTGHGLGLRYHEPVPLLAPGVTTVLEEGMVHSVEPGAYALSWGGMRVEDDLLVTATGAEVLGPAVKELVSP